MYIYITSTLTCQVFFCYFDLRFLFIGGVAMIGEIYPVGYLVGMVF